MKLHYDKNNCCTQCFLEVLYIFMNTVCGKLTKLTNSVLHRYKSYSYTIMQVQHYKQKLYETLHNISIDIYVCMIDLASCSKLLGHTYVHTWKTIQLL